MDAAHRIMDLGHSPIAPLLSHFLHIHRPRPYKDWLEADEAFVAKSDILLRLPGESSGADTEVVWAEKYDVLVAMGWEELERLLSSQVRHYPCQRPSGRRVRSRRSFSP